jgi:hypothetical protein
MADDHRDPYPDFRRRADWQGPFGRPYGQSGQSGRGIWGNQGNRGAEGYFQGWEEPDETWGGHGTRNTRVEIHRDWSVRRGYSGLGPKGYRRSDERIWEEVVHHLTAHPDIDASDIEVNVQEGEVTLSGAVNSRGARRLAVDLAESVAGVKDVHNRMRVAEPAPAAEEA